VARLLPSASVGIGDWMPRITLPLTSGRLFDSCDPTAAGHARVYWLGAPSAAVVAPLVDALAACETLLHVVAGTQPDSSSDYPSCLLDRSGELSRAVGASGPLAIVVDAASRVAAVLPQPTPDVVAARVTQLYAASLPAVVHAQAPVLLLERVVEPGLCRTLGAGSVSSPSCRPAGRLSGLLPRHTGEDRGGGRPQPKRCRFQIMKAERSPVAFPSCILPRMAGEEGFN